MLVLFCFVCCFEEGNIPASDLHHPRRDGGEWQSAQHASAGTFYLPPVQREGHVPPEPPAHPQTYVWLHEGLNIEIIIIKNIKSVMGGLSFSCLFRSRHQQARCEGVPPHPPLREHLRGGDGYLRRGVNSRVPPAATSPLTPPATVASTSGSDHI